MTGSPAFKCRSLSLGGFKNQRKIHVSSINERLSNVINQPHSSDRKMECDNRKFTKHDKYNFPSNGDVNAIEKCDPKPIRSICSSLSSFVFPCKKAVKRKLNFDVNDGSDDVGSLRFSGKNISLYGFQSTTSSVTDNRSLPDFHNATFSPNKQRRSYCRSSVSSAVSCRRRLFVESEPPLKKTKLVSPVLCRKTTSKRKEVKLSLKKKFPGVPDSDSARGGLLLNLAFSKYNLSNTKKEDVTVDFVKGVTVATATNKDFIHYNQIEKDESSLYRSPVFMAIKKVKRKLNLEDQETSITDMQQMNHLNFVDSIANKSNVDLTLLQNDAQLVNDEVVPQNDKTTLPNTITNEKLNVDIHEPVILKTHHCDRETIAASRIGVHSAPHSADMVDCDINDKGIIASTSPTVPPPTYLRNGSPSLSVKRIKPVKCLKNDLFKNSKLRSTLKNRIFDLSVVNSQEHEENARINTTHGCSATIEGKLPLRNADDDDQKIDKSTAVHSWTTFTRKDCGTNESIRNRRLMKNENERDSENIAGKSPLKMNSKTCRNTLDRRPSVKWFNRSSFVSNDFVTRARSKCETTATGCDQKFLNAHMNRFLTDCLVSVERKREKENFNDEKNDTRVSEEHIFEIQHSNAVDEISETEKLADSQLSEIIIENVDTQIEIACIENVTSQDDPIVIESVQSQDECYHVPTDDLNLCDDADLLLPKSQDCSMYVMLKDILPGRSKKSSKCINTDIVASTLHEQISSILPNEPSTDTETATASGTQTYVPDDHFKIEQISSDPFSYSCIEFTKPIEPKSAYDGNYEINTSDLLDTTKKNKRRKRAPNTLTQRLDKLLNRENSNIRMWEYEISKTEILHNDTDPQPALFCIQKMWKEYSCLILLCNFFGQNDTDASFESDRIKLLARDVSNQVVIILEPVYCPKNLTYSSVFQVHPPWKLLTFEKCDPLLMLRPRKIKIVKKYENPILYKDPSLPIVTTVRQQTTCCCCDEYRCKCLLPNGYHCCMQSLAASNISIFSPSSYTGLKHCELDTFDSGSIDDLVIKRKLFSCQYLHLDLRVLHLQRNVYQENLYLWYIICVDEKKNICCILRQGETNCGVPSDVDEDVVFRFKGILPWKMIPPKNTAFFLQYVNYSKIPEDINRMMSSQSLVLFVQSEKYGNVQRMRSM